MKITHLCLCGPVTDNLSYQDNLLTKYHKKLGYEVSIITSHFVWNNKGKIEIDKRNIYYNENNIKIIRIKSKYNTTIESKIKRYENFYNILEQENPDILFIHGVQFYDIRCVVKYLKRNPRVKVYVDNHADFSNSAQNWVSKNVLHKVIWRRCAQLIEPYVIKFYGVLPARVDFLIDIYKIPKNKVELLVMGVDDEEVSKINSKEIIRETRINEGIDTSDFLIVTGGKIDSFKKQTLLLMQAVKEIKNKKVKLIVFGSVADELKEEFYNLIDDRVKYVGWISNNEAYKYFIASDLIVFPGRHSVFWEQAVGCGIPCIFKRWNGTEHINLGGNCEFLYEDTVLEIKKKIECISENNDKYKIMKNCSREKGMREFSYLEIAKRSLREKNN